MENPIKILKELISIPSPHDISNKDITDDILRRLREFETKIYCYKKGNLDLYNLVVRIPGRRKDSPLVFVGHTDTVKPGESWKTHPFSPIDKNGKIIGLGASDMKGALACFISAITNLKKSPNQDVYLLIDADEEEGGTGGKELLKRFKLDNARVLVGEPTDRQIILGHRGCVDLEIKVSGKERHSAYTNQQYHINHSAIYKAMQICHSLREYEKEVEKRKDKILGKSTLNIGTINGGKGANTVPGNCTMKISRRFITSENLEQVVREVEEKAKDVSKKARVNVIFSGNPFASTKNSPFVRDIARVAERSLGKIRFDIKHGWTEAAIFAQYGEAVIFGPGNTKSIHQPGEYIEKEDLHLFSRIYYDLINR